MAYIRTYNTIYKISKILKNGSILIKGKFHIDKCMTDDFKQADTIEELCDVFVVNWLPTNHKDIFVIDKYSKKVIESCIGNNKTNIYGAIWTDKGLIYVAKMNKKGELVLL